MMSDGNEYQEREQYTTQNRGSDYRDAEYRNQHEGRRERDMSPRKEDRAENPGTNLFVTGLAPKVQEEDIKNLFSEYGSVNKVQIMRDPHSEDSRGFGFVDFSTKEDADRALALDGTVFMDRTLVVQKVIISNLAKRSRARTPTPGSYRGPLKDRRG